MKSQEELMELVGAFTALAAIGDGASLRLLIEQIDAEDLKAMLIYSMDLAGEAAGAAVQGGMIGGIAGGEGTLDLPPEAQEMLQELAEAGRRRALGDKE